jgi:hypothetical protein
MFIPFLIATAMVLSAFYREKALSYVLWSVLLTAIVILFNHHASDVLSLNF